MSYVLNMCGGLDWSFSEPEQEDQVALIPTDDKHLCLEFQGLKHLYMVDVMGSSLKKTITPFTAQKLMI